MLFLSCPRLIIDTDFPEYHDYSLMSKCGES